MQEALINEAATPFPNDIASLRARYASIFDEFNDGVVVQDVEGNFVEINPSAGALGVLESSWRLAPQDDDRQDGASHLAQQGAGWRDPKHPAIRAMRTKTPAERVPLIFPATADRDEKRLRVTAVPLIKDTGAVYGVLSLLYDETEAHRREQAARLDEKHFRLAIEHTPTGFALLDLSGHIVRSNRALARYLATTTEALQGRTLHSFVHRDDLKELLDQAREVIRGERELVECEVRWVRTDGAVVWGIASGAVSGPPGQAQNLVVQIQDTTHQRRTQDLLAHMALHDPLTGQPNRILVLDRIQKALERSRRSGNYVALLLCDLDRFKVVNDSLGHQAGDTVLIEIAQRVSAALRGGDTAGRLGADEFVVVCEDVVDEREAVTVAERLLHAIRRPVTIDGRGLIPTVSIGIALATTPDADPMSLLRDADTAMYRAKQSGRNTWQIADPELSRRAGDRLDLEQALGRSVAQGELSLHFQPIVDLSAAARGTVGHEALLRWRHPQRGLLSPADFLQVAEESGQIVDIGRWVIQHATTVAAAAGPDAGYVSVNVSALQLGRPGLLDTVEAALADSGLPPERLVLELTESVMLSAAPSAYRELAQLDHLGTRIVVDDFGTGFSALSYLRDLPIRGIKVDRSFTSGLGASHHCERIVEAVNALGRGLGVDVVVEGVETERQRTVLQQMGAAHAQGYLFGRPRPQLVAA